MTYSAATKFIPVFITVYALLNCKVKAASVCIFSLAENNLSWRMFMTLSSYGQNEHMQPLLFDWTMQSFLKLVGMGRRAHSTFKERVFKKVLGITPDHKCCDWHEFRRKMRLVRHRNRGYTYFICDGLDFKTSSFTYKLSSADLFKAGTAFAMG